MQLYYVIHIEPCFVLGVYEIEVPIDDMIKGEERFELKEYQIMS
jgi:hypothetical protein